MRQATGERLCHRCADPVAGLIDQEAPRAANVESCGLSIRGRPFLLRFYPHAFHQNHLQRRRFTSRRVSAFRNPILTIRLHCIRADGVPAMKRNSRHNRQRLAKGSAGPAPGRPHQAGSSLPRDLRAMSKTELVALVLELQAREATPLRPTEDPTTKSEDSSVDETQKLGHASDVRPRPALVIESSVRSGQTIDFPDGDVTVIGSVGSGAEIIAGGSIHVYGTLRGRAIAGASGDQSARIFCQDLDAELLSIDGRYRVAENFERTLRGRPVQARLDGLRMTLIPLDDSWTPPAEASAEERASADKIRRATDRVRQLMRFGVSRDAPLAETAAS